MLRILAVVPGLTLLLMTPSLRAEDMEPAPVRPFESPRILGFIPNYQTVSNPAERYQPISSRQKWHLFLQSTMDPFVISDIALGATLSQLRGGTPDYGQGGGA